jgi:vancomycin resistance protein YoaR
MMLDQTLTYGLRATSGRRGPRRSTMAMLAVVVAVVGGATTIEVAIARPAEGPSPGAASGVVAATSEAITASAAPTSAAVSPVSGSEQVPARTPASSPRHAPAKGARPATSLEPDLVLLGSWTVDYVVGPANGDGANIEIPLRRLNGRTIKPGATFDFWTAVGDVSRRTGFRRGAIIRGHRIDTDGALAGGICTVSTAVFNAAARAGLQITARTSHSGYLAKYPLGLDAAVAKGGHFRQSLAFRNDTTQPIVIRTLSAPGVARVDLYGTESLGRMITFSQPEISHLQKAHDRHVKTTSLPRGEHRRVEDRSDGMTVVVKRTVRDRDGHLLRRDRWVSVYRWLGGLVLDGAG